MTPEQVQDFKDRLVQAWAELRTQADDAIRKRISTYAPQARMKASEEAARLAGKAQGVNLAIDYLRAYEGQGGTDRD